jgi:hypothetical protein
MDECKKIQFTKIEAKSILNHNRKSHFNKKWRKEVRYYHCPECNMWHLTSREEYGEQIDIKIDYTEWEKYLKPDNKIII